jgi:hypothetical protein
MQASVGLQHRQCNANAAATRKAASILTEEAEGADVEGAHVGAPKLAELELHGAVILLGVSLQLVVVILLPDGAALCKRRALTRRGGRAGS